MRKNSNCLTYKYFLYFTKSSSLNLTYFKIGILLHVRELKIQFLT